MEGEKLNFIEKIGYALAIPRSLLINIRVFGFGGGVRIPVLFANNVRVRGLGRGSMRVADPSAFGVRIGFGGSLGISRNRALVSVVDGGIVEFKGRASFREGTVIRLDGGHLEFGRGFTSNKNCGFYCCREMSFGDDCVLGWNVTFRNSDGHAIFGPDGQLSNAPSDVRIGSHVWIAANVDVFKGANVPDGCVVAANSLVTKDFDEMNSLIGGIPAKVIRRGVSWER